MAFGTHHLQAALHLKTSPQFWMGFRALNYLLCQHHLEPNPGAQYNSSQMQRKVSGLWSWESWSNFKAWLYHCACLNWIVFSWKPVPVSMAWSIHRTSRRRPQPFFGHQSLCEMCQCQWFGWRRCVLFAIVAVEARMWFLHCDGLFKAKEATQATVPLPCSFPTHSHSNMPNRNLHCFFSFFFFSPIRSCRGHGVTEYKHIIQIGFGRTLHRMAQK